MYSVLQAFQLVNPLKIIQAPSSHWEKYLKSDLLPTQLKSVQLPKTSGYSQAWRKDKDTRMHPFGLG